MSGGNLVSDLMKEINSSDLYNEPKYNPEIEQQPGQQQEPKKNINPDDFIPPPNEDDKEEVQVLGDGVDNQEEYSSDEEDDNEYDQDVDEILKYANQEYTSFVMELIKNGIIIFIGYIIFSHPIANFYITSFISKMPVIGAFASNNNYMLLITACLFLVYYFIVSFVF
jgi:hypothetical protein